MKELLKKIKKRDKINSLKEEFLKGFLVVGIIPLVIFAIVFFIVIKNSIYNNQVNSMKQISSMLSENIDKWGENNVILVEELAGSQIVQSNNLNNIQTEFKSKLAQDISIKNILFVDKDGKVLVDGLGSKDGLVNKEVYFNEVMKGYTYISDILIEDSEEPYIVFAAPVKNDGNTIGCIINKVKSSSLDSIIGNIFFAESGTVYTFNKNGDITYHFDKEKIMNENINNSSSKELVKASENALKGIMGSTSFKVDNGLEVGVYNYIQSLGWGSMITIKSSELYAGFIKVIKLAIPLFIALVLGIVILALYSQRKIVNPIIKLARLAKKVSDGDLTVVAEVKGAKEIIEIGNDFNNMVDSLKVLTSEIKGKSDYLKNASENLNNISESVEEASREVSGAMNEIAVGSLSQAEKTSEVLQSVMELEGKMNELNDKITDINSCLDNSKEALLNGENGIEVLRSNTDNQNLLVKQTVEEVEELEKAVGNIDKIMDTIGAISEQTNLLSLNASIEAARAGESGLGFAVVAQEIGKLSKQSQDSAKQISGILKGIRSRTYNTTNLMKSMAKGMESQIESVENNTNIFKQISEAENNITKNIEGFTTLIEYINGFGQSLLTVVETLSSVSEESAAITEEVTASTEEQLAMIENLREAGIGINKIVEELEVNISKFTIR